MRAENRAAGGPALSVRQLNRATLARQMLLGRERVAAPRAIATLVALQAQLPRPPFLGLWARVEGFERKELTRLLRQRKVVRGTLLRGTLHVATAKDFVALRPAMRPVLDAGMRTILRALGASVDAERLAARAREVLAEGPQTFEQIRDRLKRDLPGTNERALGFAVRMLLPLVQVPEDDAPWAFVGNPRFALADERFVAKSHRPRVFLPGLRIAATVLVDGFVAGTWRSDRKKGVATLTVAPFAPFPARVRRDVSAEAEALLRFAEPDARSYEVRVGK